MCQFHHYKYACGDQAVWKIIWCYVFLQSTKIETLDSCGKLRAFITESNLDDCNLCKREGRSRIRKYGTEEEETVLREESGLKVIELDEGHDGALHPSARFPIESESAPIASTSAATPSEQSTERDSRVSAVWLLQQLELFDPDTDGALSFEMLVQKWNSESPHDQRNAHSFRAEVLRSVYLTNLWMKLTGEAGRTKLPWESYKVDGWFLEQLDKQGLRPTAAELTIRYNAAFPGEYRTESSVADYIRRSPHLSHIWQDAPDWRHKRDPKESEDFILNKLDEIYNTTNRRATHTELAARWNEAFPNDQRTSSAIKGQVLRSTALREKWIKQGIAGLRS